MKTPLFWPRRSTTMRSATARTSSMLCEIRMTPWPRSRTRSIRFSTSAVWATPRAAVGSSSMMICGSSSSERAMATVCRCPPESEAMGSRTEGMRAASSLQEGPGADLHLDLVELPGRHLVPEEQVGDDVEVLAEGEILEHRGDPHLERLAGVVERHLLAEILDGARGRLMHPGEHLDERRLAGAVVADQRDDLAGMDVELDVRQRGDGAELFGNAAQSQDQLPVRRRVRSHVSMDALLPSSSGWPSVPPERRGAGLPAPRGIGLLGDAELLAGLDVFAGADLVGGLDAGVEDLGP